MTLPENLVLVGTPFEPIGMGEHIRAPFRALRSVGARVRVHDVFAHEPTDDAELQQEIGPYLTDELSTCINIFCINGNQVGEVLRRLRPPLPSTSYNIIWPAWELANYPRDWVSEIQQFHEVWVASRFTEESLRAAVSIPVARMPFGIGPRLSRFRERRYFGIPEAPFVFLFMFDFLSFVERKNPFAVLETFGRLQRRRPTAAAQLVIKLNNSARRPGDHRRFLDAIAEARDHVTVIDRVMTDDEIKNLVHCCDCFVSLHRSEGFGFSLAEAMYLRKPVIGTGYSGNLDFMSVDNSCLIPYRLVPVPEGSYPYAAGQVWAEPDIDAAVDAMIRLLDDRAYRQDLGEAASRHVRTHFSYHAVGLRYVARVGEIMATARPGSPPGSLIGRPAPTAMATDAVPAPASMDHPAPLPRSPRFRVHAAGRAVGYVPDQPGTLPWSLPARVVAFYLPRFYPAPEADRGGGKGFDEWADVARALPQVEGQSQPHLPGELGFYDLRVDTVHRRQLELARHYGVGGFCYYFYWFAGKPRFETPLRRHLDDPSFTLPFCLNWANEEGTGGADGDGVPIAQAHSPADDVAFIDYISCYLRDPRYLRVDDRPLLVVNRPRRLPDPRATAQRWRERCRALGIGEILLAFSHEVDRGQPSQIGFDAAIEFAPDVAASSEVTASVRRLNPEFRGHVYDYRFFVERGVGDQDPPYFYVRSVNPGWDDEPRKPGRSHVYLNASPRGYETWLANALRDAVHRFPERDHRLVFVNAWNKWAEGAYLEPDARLGYAYLAATRRALTRIAAEQAGELHPPPATRPVCVVIHAYYPELLDEILALLIPWQVPYRLIVTTAPEAAPAVRARLAPFGRESDFRVYENRGRDILPFLRMANELADRGEALLLKLHTKRSRHRIDGDSWRRDLLAKLIGPASAQRCHSAFTEFPRLGMIAPEGHLLTMRSYWNANRENVHYLCRRLGITEADPGRQVFAAGSMFWARLDALRPLLDLHLDEAEFEAESGQVDGTMAHAIERVMALVVKRSGMYLASTSQPSVEAEPS